MGKAARRRSYALPIALGAGGLLVLSAPAWGPSVGRQISWVDVERVEISGATLVAPHEVLRVSGIHLGHSIFEEREPWESALEAHPVIAAATVSWKLPSTLRVRVVEERPVALVTGDALAPATASGEILPLDPTAVPLDLPIVRGSPADEESGAAVRVALAEAGRLADLDPLLMSDVSEVRPLGDGKAVVLVHAVGEIVVPTDVAPEQLLRLRAVLSDISQRLPAIDGEDPRSELEIDLRFDDQVVVRHPLPRERS